MADSIVKAKQEKPHWVQYIHQRIKKNKNFVCFVSGPTGSGKSWASLSMAEQIDLEFDSSRVVFTGSELLSLINSGNVKTGSVIVFEEAGIEMNNRNWQSAMNQMLNFLFQTFRHRNFILIMNAPYMDFVDAATRKLIHAEFQTVSIDKNTQKCKLKPQLIQYNARNNKFYYKRLRVILPEYTAPVSFWSVPKPSKELLDAYEPRKRAFTDKLNEKITQKLQELDADSKEDTPKDTRKPLTPIQRRVYEMLGEGKLVPDIATEMNITPSVVRFHMNAIRKKEYSIEPVKGGCKIVQYTIS